MNLEFDKLIAERDISSASLEDSAEIISMCNRARRYFRAFTWVSEIIKVYYGGGIPGMFGVYLFEFVPATSEIEDRWLWVVAGDVPPAYLVTDKAPNAKSAIQSYIFEMKKWIDAVYSGGDLAKIIPVNAEPTKKYADMLRSRLNFLEEKLLPESQYKIYQ